MHRHFYMMKRSRKLISANKGETIMSNTVITIARQYGSGGRTVGKMLAKRLDIPCYDREIISLASEESGIHPTLFQDEKKKHGSLRAFLTGGFKNASPLSPESAGFTKDDNLFRYQAKIIRQLAEESSCVIIGRPYPCRCSRRCPCLCPRTRRFLSAGSNEGQQSFCF